MAANNNVVGDLNKVVDLGSLSNNRIANPAAIDRRSSSNLDIVFNCNHAKLRHLEVPGCLHDETKSVLADVTPRMNDDAIANDRVRYRTSWADRTLPSNSNVWPNHAVGADQRSGADSSPRPYDRTGIDRRANCELSGAMDRCARRDAVRFEKRRGTQCVWIKFASHKHEALIRLWREQHDEAARSERLKMFADQDGASPRCSERLRKFRVVYET